MRPVIWVPVVLGLLALAIWLAWPDPDGGGEPPTRTDATPSPGGTANGATTGRSAARAIDSDRFTQNDPPRGSDTERRVDLVVTGRVLDPLGAPVTDAEVRLFRGGRSPGRDVRGAPPVTETKTGAGGRFQIATTDHRWQYRLEVIAAPFARAERRVDPERADTLHHVIRLLQGASVAGTVVDDTGAPVAAARVSVSAARPGTGPELEVSVETNRIGRYRVNGLSAGSKTLIVRHPAHAIGGKAGFHLAEVGETTIDVTLTAAHRIQGVVIDRRTGAPIANASATAELVAFLAPGFATPVVPGGGSDGGGAAPSRPRRAINKESVKLLGFLAQTVTTDARGEFECMGLRNARYRLRVTASGYAAVAVIADVGPELVTVKLEDKAPWTGRVVVAGTNASPHTYRTAFARGEDSPPEESQVETAADGAFERADAGLPYLVIAAPGHPPERISLQGRDPRVPIVVRLRAGVELVGRVLGGDGRPGADAVVSLYRAPRPGGAEPSNPLSKAVAAATLRNLECRVRTDDEGRFQISGIEPGRWRVEADHDLWVAASPPPFRAEGGRMELPDLALGIGGTVRGRLTRPDGGPDGRAQVLLRAVGGTRSRTVSTDPDGRWSCRGVHPGRYRVFVVRRAGVANPVALLGAGSTVTVSAGAVVIVP